ncbi:MAG: winged helix-turn-helix domain-containing protein [Bacteroidota bacterium]
MRSKLISLLLIVLVSFLLAPSISQAHDIQNEQQLEVVLRMIGHQVLLNSGDSVSRVLPIEKEEDRYRILFDTEFAFDPGELALTVEDVIRTAGMNLNYFMAVHACETGEVVHSYRMYIQDQGNMTPCIGRKVPKSCYQLLFTLVETSETNASPSISSAFHVSGTDPSEGSQSKSKQLNYISILGLFMLIIMGCVVFWKKRSQPHIDTNLIPLGEFHFDKRNSELVMRDERIELTSKEADLLLLLHNDVNSTIEREVILNRVWGDEGSYVGRTLDVFISKLRKKLEADPSVKIVNIRGVGYKLVVDV